jgi:26S proteasome regulatory subunit N6
MSAAMDTSDEQGKVAPAPDSEEYEPGIEEYHEAMSLVKINPREARKKFEALLDGPDIGTRVKERSIYGLCHVYVHQGQADEIRGLLLRIRPFFASIPKRRTARIVRKLIDTTGELPDSIKLQTSLCEESIAWCRREKRAYLRHRIQSKLADLYLQQNRFKESLDLVRHLLREVKKIDDKLLQVETELTESKIHFALQNTAVAKSALTAARAASHSVYCPPELQAQIDLQSGIICAAEHDFKTSYSYFYEAYEGFSTLGNKQEEAMRGLKYMLLAKILTNSPKDVYGIIHGKVGMKNPGPHLDAMRSIAEAHKQRSLKQFQQALVDFKHELVDDPIIEHHLATLYEELLEQNILRLVEPFTRVEISHVAELMEMPMEKIEPKLSEMILDKKLNGILDHGAGCLIVFEEEESDKTYEHALGTIKELSSVVDQLSKKAQKLRE